MFSEQRLVLGPGTRNVMINKTFSASKKSKSGGRDRLQMVDSVLCGKRKNRGR